MRQLLSVCALVALASVLSGQMLMTIVGGKSVSITGAPPVFVSTACETAVAAVSTQACLVNGVIAGGSIIVTAWISSTVTMTSTTDDCGDTYNPVDMNVLGANGQLTSVMYASNVTGGNCTVTAHFSSAANNKSITVTSIRGTRTAGLAMDQHSFAALASSNTVCSNDCLAAPAVTTQENNEFIFAACIANVTTPLYNGSGFTPAIFTNPPTRAYTEYKTRIPAGNVIGSCNRSTTASATVTVHLLTLRSSTPI